MEEVDVSIAALRVYPVKSCAGVALNEVLVIETGLEFDRAWMLVDGQGEFVSQRELPRLALVRCELRTSELVLRAPGMLALHLALDTVGDPTRVRIWSDEVAAYEMGALADQWFSDFFHRPLRLVRFDPEQKRLASRDWTGDIEAEAAFSDEYPFLVLSQASLDALNERLALRDVAPVTIERFRPNLVLTGLDAHGEDYLDEIAFETPEGEVRLKLVKPCPRCPIPNVDPLTGDVGREPGDTLAGYRSDARVGGAISFGMNAVLVEGIERSLRVGQRGRATLRF
jgi:uncharacterized protein YcbX